MTRQQRNDHAGMPAAGDRWLLWIIVAAAAVLRLYHYSGWSLSNDELSALARLRFHDLPALIDGGVKPDMHPAGVQLFLYAWTGMAGLSPWAVRLPFVLAGILSVYLLFRTGSILLNRHAGLAAAALLAVLEYPIQYSQLARPYSFGLLFVLAAAFFWARIFFPERVHGSPGTRPTRWDYAGFVLSVSACMYTHYFAMFQAGLLCLSGLALVDRAVLRNYLLCGAAIVLLYLPHAGILAHHLSTGGLGGDGGWLGPPDMTFVTGYLRYAFNGSRLLLAMSAGFCLLSLAKLSRRPHRVPALLAAWFVVPFATGYVYSILVNPVLQFSVLLFAFPFLLLFLFSFLPGRPAPLYPVPLTAFLLVAGASTTVFARAYYRTEHFAVFRDLAEQAVAWNQTYGASRITRTANLHDAYYLQYYFDRLGSREPFAWIRCNTYDDMHAMVDAVAKSDTPFFLYAWSNILDLPETEAVIRSRFPFVAGRSLHFNSGAVLYTRDSAWYRPASVLLDETIPLASPAKGMDRRDSAGTGAGWTRYRMDSTVEFSPGFESRSLVVDTPYTAMVAASFVAGTPPKAQLVFSIDNDAGTLVWIGRELAFFLIDGDSTGTAYAAYRAGQPLTGHETVKAYVWNSKKETLYLNEIKILIVKD